MARKMKCELCGKTFECSGWPSCWCASVKVSQRRLNEISLLTADCVCPKCLSAKATPARPKR